MGPYGLQSHNRSSQFSGVFFDSQAFSRKISISRDSPLPLDKKTNKISRKSEILILHGTGCIAANGTPHKCGFPNFWTNGKPVLKTVPLPQGVPSVEDKIGGSAIQADLTFGVAAPGSAKDGLPAEVIRSAGKRAFDWDLFIIAYVLNVFLS